MQTVQATAGNGGSGCAAAAAVGYSCVLVIY